MAGHLLPSATTTYNLGSSSFKWSNVYATTFNGEATSAQYADLAEMYTADGEIAPGTVVCFDQRGFGNFANDQQGFGSFGNEQPNGFGAFGQEAGGGFANFGHNNGMPSPKTDAFGGSSDPWGAPGGQTPAKTYSHILVFLVHLIC